MASQPPSSVIAACRTVTAIPLAAQSRRAALTRRWTVSTSGGPSMSATLRWPNSRDVTEEQPHRAGLVHDHVVAVIRPPAVHVHVRDPGHPRGVLGLPQRGGQQQAVRAALLDQVPVGAGRLGVLPGLLHDHDHVAAIAGPLQRPSLEPHPDRVAQQRDDERDGPGLAPLQRPIKQPNPGSGLGYWPAFWMLGAGFRASGAGTSGTMTCSNWPSVGEIDVMEDVNALSEVAGTLHCGVDPGGPCNETTGQGSGLVSCSGCQTGYNTYSVIVNRTNTSNESITWLLNGTVYHTVTESQIGTSAWQAAVDHGFFLILDVASAAASRTASATAARRSPPPVRARL